MMQYVLLATGHLKIIGNPVFKLTELKLLKHRKQTPIVTYRKTVTPRVDRKCLLDHVLAACPNSILKRKDTNASGLVVFCSITNEPVYIVIRNFFLSFFLFFETTIQDQAKSKSSQINGVVVTTSLSVRKV